MLLNEDQYVLIGTERQASIKGHIFNHVATLFSKYIKNNLSIPAF